MRLYLYGMRSVVAGILGVTFTFGLLLGHGEDLKPVFPGTNWERVKPEALSYASARLDILRNWIKTQKTTACYRGAMQPLQPHSISTSRKIDFERTIRRTKKAPGLRRGLRSVRETDPIC